MGLRILIIVARLVYRLVSRRLAIALVYRVSRVWTWWKFHSVADRDLADAWRKVYAATGSGQRVSVDQERDALYVRTDHCWIREQCMRWGCGPLVLGFCEGDADYWKARLGDWYWKDVGPESGQSHCLARFGVNHGTVGYKT